MSVWNHVCVSFRVSVLLSCCLSVVMFLSGLSFCRSVCGVRVFEQCGVLRKWQYVMRLEDILRKVLRTASRKLANQGDPRHFFPCVMSLAPLAFIWGHGSGLLLKDESSVTSLPTQQSTLSFCVIAVSLEKLPDKRLGLSHCDPNIAHLRPE